MNLEILLPERIFLRDKARKVVADTAHGSYCVEPRHIDFVTALEPGLMVYENPEGNLRYLALNEGVLVKAGDQVRASVENAVRGELEELQEMLAESLRKATEEERKTRNALHKLEASIVRRFMELEERP